MNQENVDSSILVYDPCSKENMTMDYRNSNYKKIQFFIPQENINIIVNQDFKVGKGGIFWDGVKNNKHYLKSKDNLNILELGAGTALPSLLALYFRHRVLITDVKRNLKIIEENISDNHELVKNGSSMIEELTWGDDVHIENIKSKTSSFDIIICSELVYWEDLFDDLIYTIEQISDNTTKIFFSYKIRLQEIVDIFHEKFSKNFSFEYVNQETVDLIYPVKNMRVFIAWKK